MQESWTVRWQESGTSAGARWILHNFIKTFRKSLHGPGVSAEGTRNEEQLGYAYSVTIVSRYRYIRTLIKTTGKRSWNTNPRATRAFKHGMIGKKLLVSFRVLAVYACRSRCPNIGQSSCRRLIFPHSVSASFHKEQRHQMIRRYGWLGGRANASVQGLPRNR